MQPPDKMTKEMIEDYLLYLKKEKGNALTTISSAITGIRFFCNHVLGDEQLSPSCSFAKTSGKLPTVLSQEESWSIINATGNIKHRLLLMTTYSAGLRASEVLSLKAEHIDGKRMLIKVTGKGGKQRYTLLSNKLPIACIQTSGSFTLRSQLNVPNTCLNISAATLIGWPYPIIVCSPSRIGRSPLHTRIVKPNRSNRPLWRRLRLSGGFCSMRCPMDLSKSGIMASWQIATEEKTWQKSVNCTLYRRWERLPKNRLKK
jgi:hypothetical protein